MESLRLRVPIETGLAAQVVDIHDAIMEAEIAAGRSVASPPAARSLVDASASPRSCRRTAQAGATEFLRSRPRNGPNGSAKIGCEGAPRSPTKSANPLKAPRFAHPGFLPWMAYDVHVADSGDGGYDSRISPVTRNVVVIPSGMDALH